MENDFNPIYDKFRSKLRSLGNSEGIIIPKHVLDDWKIKKGEQVVVQIIRTEKITPSETIKKDSVTQDTLPAKYDRYTSGKEPTNSQDQFTGGVW